MNCRTLSFSIAVLLCLAAMPFLLGSTAFAGQGCGTNWMGDTTGDTDFYVSKNQNAAASDVQSNASSAPAKAAKALGSVAKASKNATIQNLISDRPSPQSPGSVIVWSVEASNPDNVKMLYNFLLTGPSTGGQLKDETGWIAERSWTWNTTDADAGENQIVVRAMRAGSSGFEDSEVQSYVIATNSQNKDVTSVDAHPESRTSKPISDRPRVAPDEMSIVSPTTSGPNMQMPDTKPIPLVQATTQATGEADEPVQVEPQEPEFMEVEGKWTIKLDNTGAILNPLTLIQTGESVMGMGTLNEQNKKLQVNAKGSVSKNTMSLEAWTIVSEYGNKVDEQIELDLVKVDKVVSGSYKMYSGDDLIGTGNVTASRFAS